MEKLFLGKNKNTEVITETVVETVNIETKTNGIATKITDVVTKQAINIIPSKPNVKEDIKKRTLNTKHYKCADGSFNAVIYNEPVHYYDETSKSFVDIDNSLAEKKDTIENTNNNFKVKFTKAFNKGKIFSVLNDAHELTLNYVGNNVKNKSLKSNSAALKNSVLRNSEIAQVVDSDLVYSNIYDGIDLEYKVLSNRIKENIIIKSLMDEYIFDFQLNIGTLTPQMSEDNKNINLCNELGKVIYTIPCPIMYDSDNNSSDDVYYEIEKSGSILNLNIIASSEWINDSLRVLPITIDPQIIIPTTGLSITNYSYKNGILGAAGSACYIGNGSAGITSSSYDRTYMAITMPDLGNNPIINSASLNIVQDAYASGCVNTMLFGVHKVTGNISSGVTAYESIPADFEKINTTATSYSLDITSLMTIWQNENSLIGNLVLKSLEENTAYHGKITVGSTPTITINYNSGAAIKNSESTTQFNIERAGSAELNLFSGAIKLVHDDINWGGLRMPVAISHIYNGSISNKNFTSSDDINTVEFSIMKQGLGWKINYLQTLIAFDAASDEYISGYRYLYLDENGYSHYFIQNTNTVKNTLGEEVTTDIIGSYIESDSGYVYTSADNILKKDGYNYVFGTHNCLTAITDANSNTLAIDIVLINNLPRINKISDGVGREFIFAYDASNYLISITDPLQNLTEFTYADDCLTKIKYPDGHSSKYSYNTGDYKKSLKKAINVQCIDSVETDKFGMEFGYALNSAIVISSKEISGTNERNNISYAYNTPKRFTIETSSSESSTGSIDAVKKVYCFNSQGNTVSSYINSADTGSVYLSGKDSDTDDDSNTSVNIVSNVINFLKNHDFEKSTEVWKTFEADTFAATARTSFSTVKKNTGNYSADITTTTILKQGLYQDSITLPAGDYTLSAYVQTDGQLQGTGGAFVEVYSTALNSIYSETDRTSEVIKDSGDNFDRISVSFTLATSGTVRAMIGIKNAIGKVYFDSIQLEKNAYSNNYNILENGNFEDNFNGWGEPTSNVALDNSVMFNMTRSVKITGNTTGAGQIYQEVKVNSSSEALESFVLSGWAKGCCPVLKDRNGLKGGFGLKAIIEYANETEDSEKYQVFTKDFYDNIGEWQFASLYFSKTKFKPISKITVVAYFDYNPVNVNFDAIQLVRTDIETIDADYFTATTAEETTTTSDGEDIDLNKYDQYKNKITDIIYKNGYNGAYYTSNQYSTNGNDKIAESNERNILTSYTIDEETSLTETISKPLMSDINYTYNTSRIIKNINTNLNNNPINVAYTYNNFNGIEGITNNGFEYELKYNEFKDLNSVGIKNKVPFVSYNYNNTNNQVKNVTFANGDKAEYLYDSTSTLIEEKWKDSLDNIQADYKYIRDGQGKVVRCTDLLNCIEYIYYYDNETLKRSTESKYSLDDNNKIINRQLLFSQEFKKDSESRIAKEIFNQGDSLKEYISKYADNEDALHCYTLPTGAEFIKNKDALNRLDFTQIKLNNDKVLANKYSYIKGEYDKNVFNKVAGAPTTSLISSIAYNDGSILCYIYDENNNIICIKENNKIKSSYSYDALNRLIREDNEDSQESIDYVYDNGGNILSKNIYNYINSIRGLQKESTKTYTYDTNWKDQLTAYSPYGNITYDDVGNPINYNNLILSWEKGRQLKAINANNKSLIFRYNSEGIRIEKIFDDVIAEVKKTHRYYLKNKNIQYEVITSRQYSGSSTNKTILYLYDGDDNIIGLQYEGADYYYKKNLQNDIIAIYDADGNIITKYAYDSWGRVIYVKDNQDNDITNVDHIGKINPFRYRSYYYDTETKLYYLNSRYYDAELCRFINSDEFLFVNILSDIKGLNLYSYCMNNPILLEDREGYSVALLSASIPLALNLPAIKAALCSMTNLLTVVIAIGAMVTLLVLLLKAAQAVKAHVDKCINAKKQLTPLRHVVYVLTKSNKNVFYVGRTKNYNKRMDVHRHTKKINFKDYIVFTNLDLITARIAEQEVISAYTLTTLSSVVGGNMIRGISAKKVKEIYKQASSLLEIYLNIPEDEYLNLIGS